MPKVELAIYFLFLLGLPALLVAISPIGTEQKRKWVLVQLMFSWLGFLCFLFMMTVRYLRSQSDGRMS
ncbi:MAG: hypothetical protein GWM87_06580 [Xanthomonadales bacterium]|nr:hypothetical protein [Xanthomonadales bacterium]NIX12633.1 hypothetical protein [Xanthomonadales bacterium]